MTIDLATLRAHQAGGDARFLPVEGVDLHLVDQGPRAAPAVLLLSAQWLGTEQGDRWAPVLLAAGYRVLRVDLPGHGLTGPFPDGDYSAARYARLLGALVDALGLNRYVVVGTSHSGIAAALHAAQAPAGLRGLVLATSSGMPRAAGGPAPNVPPEDPALAEDEWGRRPRAFYAWKLATLLKRPMPAERFESIVDRIAAADMLPGRAEEARLRIAQYDRTVLGAALPHVTVPTLVQWSSDSTYLPPAMAQAIAARLPACAGVTIYPQTGHLLIADAPEETARDVVRFLETL